MGTVLTTLAIIAGGTLLVGFAGGALIAVYLEELRNEAADKARIAADRRDARGSADHWPDTRRGRLRLVNHGDAA